MNSQDNTNQNQTGLINTHELKGIKLTDFGLTEADLGDINKACSELGAFSESNVSIFGQGLSSTSKKYSDDLLSLVQNKDLDETGEKINSVLKTAKSLNTKSLINQERKKFYQKGVLGLVFNKFSDAKENFLSEFKSTKEQVEALVNEIEKSQTGLNVRVELLEAMYQDVHEEHRQIGVYIVAGEIKKRELAKEIEIFTNNVGSDYNGTELFDLNAAANSLEKRIHDFKLLQQSAKQTLPSIRVIQNNNRMLVDKFRSIKTVTLPAWKNQITLALSLNEQKNGVLLAETVDDTTNELLRMNADLLKTNTIDTAKANQRGVIDYSTLEYVQNSLIETITEMGNIQSKGMADRANEEIKLKELQSNLTKLALTDARTIKAINNIKQ